MREAIVQRLTGAAAVVVASILVLSGCASMPWTVADAATSPSPSTSASASASPSEVISVINELATGSAVHQLSAGAIGVAVTYWSDLSMDQWTAGASKPLSFSMSTSLTGDGGQSVYLSQVRLVTAVTGADGPLTAPAEVSDRSTITPGYLVKDPYSYSQSFVLPALDPAATSVTFTIIYELLLQTTPTSSEYSKQTATDTLTVAIAAA